MLCDYIIAVLILIFMFYLEEVKKVKKKRIYCLCAAAVIIIAVGVLVGSCIYNAVNGVPMHYPAETYMIKPTLSQGSLE